MQNPNLKALKTNLKQATSFQAMHNSFACAAGERAAKKDFYEHIDATLANNSKLTEARKILQ